MSCSNACRPSQVKQHETWVHDTEFGVCHYTSAPLRTRIRRKSSYIQDLASLVLTVPCETAASLPSLWPLSLPRLGCCLWSGECGHGEHRGTHCLRQVCHGFPNSLATLQKPTTEPSYFLGNFCQATDTPAPPLTLADTYQLHSVDTLHLCESPHCTIFIMSYIVLLFFLKSYYLRLCVWRISFWSYANCFNFVSLRAKETGLHNQALANEGELLERRDFMKLILEVLDLTGSSLCWSSCVLEVTMLLAPASAEVLVFLRSPCFLLAVSFHDFLGKKYELHHPRYCVQLLFSIAFWLGFFFFPGLESDGGRQLLELIVTFIKDLRLGD